MERPTHEAPTRAAMYSDAAVRPKRHMCMCMCIVGVRESNACGIHQAGMRSTEGSCALGRCRCAVLAPLRRVNTQGALLAPFTCWRARRVHANTYACEYICICYAMPYGGSPFGQSAAALRTGRRPTPGGVITRYRDRRRPTPATACIAAATLCIEGCNPKCRRLQPLLG